MRKSLILALVITLFFPFIRIDGIVNAGDLPALLQGITPQPAEKIDPRVKAELASLPPGEMLAVIVTMNEQADLKGIPGADRAARQQGVIQALQAKAHTSQRQVRQFLAMRDITGTVGQVTPFWVFNGLAVTAAGEVIQELASRSDVARISADQVDIVPSAPLEAGAPETNLATIHAPDLWNMGFTGAGIVVANMDSGVDASHPDLASRWRGGSNSWFDPYGQHPTPADLSGHGTWTMGVMVGGDAGGTSIGAAPQSQWIAVKIFNDAGSATATAIHQGFQWLLDPDGNPATADAPHVVNNSWTFGSPGCNLEFQLDMQALQAADILPVFSAGNFGPYASTSVSPANYPEVVAVGAVSNNDLIDALSSRGPSACGETQTTYPELVAPGVDIHTSDLNGLYTSASGTSLAAPHVSGVLALLLSAFPNLSASQQRSALIQGAADLGASGADNDYGYGRLDAMAAYQWLQAGGAATPTPSAPVNLALNQSVSVSSFQDSSSTGGMAVDSSLATLWMSAKATGKNKSSAEWINIDLGSLTTVGQVVLEWDANYATQYAIQISSDNTSWETVANTSAGDGGNDTITFNATQARYVRMFSTAWSNGSLRAWLKEFEVYTDGNTSPTATPTPAPTPTATPPPGGDLSVHIGDLDSSSTPGNRGRWDAAISIYVHDSSESPVAGATVSGSWVSGANGSASCTTDSSGACTINASNIKGNISSVTFAVSNITAASPYLYSANHDPDGDSDGTSITVTSP